ncbi:MAG: CpsD/CapB family tyrosine-protein kinase, partial [Clostridiaceae bacterium]|nr:CpsD/CapB family tyrosine-protein kinase [Clostridiaceae bacterium]
MHDNVQLITYTNPKSPISEAYRVLRTNIQFSSVDNPLKAIVVTSAGP